MFNRCSIPIQKFLIMLGLLFLVIFQVFVSRIKPNLINFSNIVTNSLLDISYISVSL